MRSYEVSAVYTTLPHQIVEASSQIAAARKALRIWHETVPGWDDKKVTIMVAGVQDAKKCRFGRRLSIHAEDVMPQAAA